MADTNTCDVTARAEILDIKQRLTDAEEAIVGKAEVTHAHSGADYIGATEEQLACLEALAAAFEQTGDVLDAYALADHTHSEYAVTGHTHSNYATTNHTHSDYAAKSHTHSEYATKTYVTEQINGIDIPKVDLTNYATKSYVQGQIDAIDIPEVDLTGYYTRTETDEYFATIGYVDDVIADIDIDVDLTGYATKDYVTQEINELVLSGDGPQVDLSIYALKTDIQEIDLSDYALKTDVPTVPTKVSAFTNDAGYLTEHQDLSNYATLGYVDDAVAAAVAGGEINLEGYLLKADFDKVARENGYLTEIQIQSLIISYLNTFKENMPYAEELMI